MPTESHSSAEFTLLYYFVSDKIESTDDSLIWCQLIYSVDDLNLFLRIDAAIALNRWLSENTKNQIGSASIAPNEVYLRSAAYNMKIWRSEQLLCVFIFKITFFFLSLSSKRWEFLFSFFFFYFWKRLTKKMYQL